MGGDSDDKVAGPVSIFQILTFPIQSSSDRFSGTEDDGNDYVAILSSLLQGISSPNLANIPTYYMG